MQKKIKRLNFVTGIKYWEFKSKKCFYSDDDFLDIRSISQNMCI